MHPSQNERNGRASGLNEKASESGKESEVARRSEKNRPCRRNGGHERSHAGHPGRILDPQESLYPPPPYPPPLAPCHSVSLFNGRSLERRFHEQALWTRTLTDLRGSSARRRSARGAPCIARGLCVVLGFSLRLEGQC